MKDETGKVTFDTEEQNEVNRIVEERLAREKGKYADYEDVKGIAEELKAYGYQGTPAEIRQAIKQQREETQRQNELQELQEQAKTEGTSPELLAEIKEAKRIAKEASDKLKEYETKEQSKMKEVEAKKEADEAWNKQVKEFTETYGDVDLDQLALNPKFVKFVKGKHLPLKELYEDFIDFVGETEVEAIKKVMSKEQRSTSGGKGTNTGGDYGLTDSQKKTVEEWNRKNPNMKMSYKEYAEKL